MSDNWLRIYFEEAAYTTLPCTQSTTAHALCVLLLKKKGLPVPAGPPSSAPLLPLTHALYVRDAQQDHIFERRLAPEECPLQIQEKSKKHGNTEHFRILFKLANATSNQPNNGSDWNPTLDAQAQPNDAGSPQAGNFDDFDDSLDPGLLSSSPLSFGVSSRHLTVQPSLTQQAMAADPTIMRCGYLDKRGKRNTAWKERWFEIKPNGLHYYKSHSHGAPIATIPLADAFVKACHTDCQNGAALPFVASPSITNLTASPPLPTPHAHSSLTRCSYEFEIHTVVRVFFLRARSYPEMLNWIQDIESLIPRCNENDIIDELDMQITEQEFGMCNETDARLLSLASMGGLLANGIAVEQLVQFESDRKAGGERSILAFLEVDAFARASSAGVKSKAQMLTRAQTIYDTFLSPTATQCVGCITPDQREYVRSSLSVGSAPPTLFSSIQSSLFGRLEEHTYPAFVSSSHFQRAAIKLAMVGQQTEEGRQKYNDTQTTDNTAVSEERRGSNAPATAITDANTSEDKVEVITDAVVESDVDRSAVDDSHSISGGPVGGAGLLSSLYDVGSAAVGAVGALAGAGIEALQSPSPTDTEPTVDPTLANGANGTAGQNMTPASLASYLESVGHADAIKRSASVTAHNQPDHSTDNQAESDSDESEQEAEEEESIFGATPKVSSTLFDVDGGDRASFSITTATITHSHTTTKRQKATIFDSNSNAPSRSTSITAQATSSSSSSSGVSSSSPCVVVSDSCEDDFFTLSRTRSVEGAQPVRPTNATTTPSLLEVIDEVDSRPTPAHSIAGPQTSGDSSHTAHDTHTQTHAPTEKEHATTEQRTTGALPSSTTTTTTTTTTTSKWKQTKSIFDDDDDSDSSALAPSSSSPFAGSYPRPSPSHPPAVTSTSGPTALDLAGLEEQAVDLADLNLDEEADMF